MRLTLPSPSVAHEAPDPERARSKNQVDRGSPASRPRLPTSERTWSARTAATPARQGAARASDGHAVVRGPAVRARRRRIGPDGDGGGSASPAGTVSRVPISRSSRRVDPVRDARSDRHGRPERAPRWHVERLAPAHDVTRAPATVARRCAASVRAMSLRRSPSTPGRRRGARSAVPHARPPADDAVDAAARSVRWHLRRPVACPRRSCCSGLARDDRAWRAGTGGTETSKPTIPRSSTREPKRPPPNGPNAALVRLPTDAVGLRAASPSGRRRIASPASAALRSSVDRALVVAVAVEPDRDARHLGLPDRGAVGAGDAGERE